MFNAKGKPGASVNEIESLREKVEEGRLQRT
jgi:hypothetical protein